MFPLAIAWLIAWAAQAVTLPFPLGAPKQEPQAVVTKISRLPGDAPYSSHADLIRFLGRWYVAFREGKAVDSSDGAIRILSSIDMQSWQPAGLLDYPVADLREPRFAMTPGGKLMLTAAAAMHPPSGVRWKTFGWFSTEGRDWTSALTIAEPEIWMWQVAWHLNLAYGIGRVSQEVPRLGLFLSRDGAEFRPFNPQLQSRNEPGDASLVFLPDNRVVALLARDKGTAQLGMSTPPYRGWTWRNLAPKISAPAILRLPDDRIVAVAGVPGEPAQTALFWLDTENAELKQFLTLPSKGETGSAGLAWYDDTLYVAYASSHEGPSRVYLATVKVPERK